MHLTGDLIGQDLTISTLQGVERRPHDSLRRTLGGLDIARKVGVDETRMEPYDLRALFGKFEAKTVGQRPCG